MSKITLVYNADREELFLLLKSSSQDSENSLPLLNSCPHIKDDSVPKILCCTSRGAISSGCRWAFRLLSWSSETERALVKNNRNDLDGRIL